MQESRVRMYNVRVHTACRYKWSNGNILFEKVVLRTRKIIFSFKSFGSDVICNKPINILVYSIIHIYISITNYQYTGICTLMRIMRASSKTVLSTQDQRVYRV